LVLQSIPNNRLGNFPEIWIHLIAHWFWIPFARCGSQSKQPIDTLFSMIRGPWFVKHPKQPVAKSAGTDVETMTGGSQGGSRRYGITVLQPCQTRNRLVGM
jgi:hypothetical protein